MLIVLFFRVKSVIEQDLKIMCVNDFYCDYNYYGLVQHVSRLIVVGVSA